MPAIPTNRITSIDFLKGVVMVIMALDHTRDFFYKSPGLMDVTNPATASVALYLTRWFTHFCAPSFSFLAGLSAFMIGRRKSKAALSKFLLTRGLWLLFIELTVISFAWYFDSSFHNVDFAVIGSLGVSMIFLAALIYLPRAILLILSCLIIAGHNLMDSIHFDGSILWSILHEFKSFTITPALHLNVAYPIIPWIAVMSLGYCFGDFYKIDFAASKRRKLFNSIALISIICFVALRFTNVYGDPGIWKQYETSTQTTMSFFNLNKYPPSLLYLMVTLSGALLFLANTENLRGRLVNFFTVFGRVPFFYYIIHLYTIHLLAAVLAEVSGFGWRIMVQDNFDPDLKGFGYGLGTVYLIWIGIILALYPLCKKFDAYKQSHKEKWWLSYL